MALKVAERGRIPPFIVMDVLRAALEREARGEDVVHLEVGQPSTPAPTPVRAAAREALDRGRLGYTDALGTRVLRERIARHYRERYGVEVDPDRIAVTTGSSAAFLLVFLSAFEPGDRVGVPVPGYPAYRHILRAVGVEAVPLRLRPEEGFRPRVEDLEACAPLDGLVVASPANPTGVVLEPSELRDLLDFAGSEGIRVISDEIYHGIVFGEPAASAARSGEGVVVVNSFSKYYSMTGWRLGWLVLPDDLVRSVECLAQNLYISPPALSQAAAPAAFDASGELDDHVARYRRNLELLREGMEALGVRRWAPARGAFYLYVDVSPFTEDSEEFCRRMLAEAGVAATPGTDFDPEEGRRWIRFSVAGAEEEIREAVGRLAGWWG